MLLWPKMQFEVFNKWGSDQGNVCGGLFNIDCKDFNTPITHLISTQCYFLGRHLGPSTQYYLHTGKILVLSDYVVVRQKHLQSKTIALTRAGDQFIKFSAETSAVDRD